MIEMDTWLSSFVNTIQGEMVIRLLLAALFGGVVGMERGSGDRPAGFRTHILVCAGSALIMLVSMYGFEGYDVVPLEYPRNAASAFWAPVQFYTKESRCADLLQPPVSG